MLSWTPAWLQYFDNFTYLTTSKLTYLLMDCEKVHLELEQNRRVVITPSSI